MRHKVLAYLRRKGGSAFLARLIDDVDNGDLDVLLMPRGPGTVAFAMSYDLYAVLTELGNSGLLAPFLDDDAMVTLAPEEGAAK